MTATTFAHTPSTWRRQILPCEMGDVLRLAGVKLAEVERMYGGEEQ